MTNLVHQSIASILTDCDATRRDIMQLEVSINSVITLLKVLTQQLDKNSKSLEKDLPNSKSLAVEELEVRMERFDGVLDVILNEYDSLVKIS